MKKVKIFADKNIKIGKIDKKLFGSFIEHMGRAVYTGIYEPGHFAADSNGFRRDVIDLIKELNVPMVRYPGGNFLSGYNWEDGIGDKSKRPTRLDLAWQTVEDNQFGTDEFMDWCADTGIEPMFAVNLGTGTPKEAGNLVEYCNFKGGTYYSDLRIKNGHKNPYNIKYWCLGNEMDGPWQICRLSAEDYAKKALETAKIIKWIDEDTKLIACGSSGAEMETYPEWDRVVLETLYDKVDYISMHRYYWEDGNLNDFLASFSDMNEFIRTVKATADYVKAKTRSKKTMKISFDEWNVWYQNKQKPAGWVKAPHILEDIYSLKDALVFGGMLNTLINNCDRVEIACLAQLVNVIAPIFTAEGGKAIRQTIFYPFKEAACYAGADALMSIVSAPKFPSKYGDTDIVSNSIVYDENKREIAVFLCNYEHEDCVCDIELRSFGDVKAVSHRYMNGNDMEAQNTLENPDRVTLKDADLPEVKNNILTLKAKPMSYNAVILNY